MHISSHQALEYIKPLQNKCSMTYDHLPVTFVKPGAAYLELSLVYYERFYCRNSIPRSMKY